ncbi:acyl-coenzyme A thioesterase 8 isoform X1 [Eucalyptus grandis]|uniref:Uncharacterized protein n=2 Tax=Eucalyptus grandis TaxID=71139 RepID=A0ACC3KSX6_EUCGR|nr:acyl-coenzyme A thioesterase 8 isoform X1 [Eucalyptus grandis]KAK3428653.1 hypothetical protein EUGRSUZ_E00141 [Eucalyptus grandis]
MDSQSVVEFLGCVPLLQKLPTSSLRKIADAVTFKHYDKGAYVVHEGDVGEGVYFIWEGEAEVSGPVDSEDPDFKLSKYDYFGHGTTIAVHAADIIALSKLTCIVLPHEHCHLLQPKSIWSSDETKETCSLVERILHLEPIEVNIFQGITLPEAPRFGKVFGGQFIAQAAAAASKTVDCLKVIHSLHVYFLLVGDLIMPIIYEVHRLRDGKNFATRRVDAIQKGTLIFTLIASFQTQEEGFEHQVITMPSVPAPETPCLLQLLSMEQLRERRLIDPRLPRGYRNKVATTKFIPWPIEIRFCEPSNATNQTETPPSLRYWFKAKGKLSDDQALHRCVVAFASDLIFLGTSLNPHRRKGLKTYSVSLDHAMWFHRNLRADDWILFEILSPIAHNARGLVSGRMFSRNGELLVTLTQEGLIRKAKPSASVAASKL